MGLNYGSSTASSSSSGGGCCRCTCVKSQMAALIVLFLSLSLSFVLLILAGTAKPGSWLPMINIIAVVFLPMFILIADTIGGAPTVMHDCALAPSCAAPPTARAARTRAPNHLLTPCPHTRRAPSRQ